MRKNTFGEYRKKFFLAPVPKKDLIDRLKNILKTYNNISFAYIYGSFLTGEDFADIDIAVFLSNNSFTSKEQAFKQEIDLEITLQDEIGYPIDLRVINFAPLSFCYNVLKDGRLLCSKDEDLKVDFVTRTIINYIDFLPHRKRYLKEVLGLEV